MSVASESIMDRLRRETSALHQFAESRALQKQMANGTVPLTEFTEYLGQLLFVHRALEAGLDRCRATVSAIEEVVFPTHFHSRELELDLIHFGIDIDRRSPGEPTAAFIRSIESYSSEEPIALLGCLYVLEGSMNGNRFLARTLGRAFGIKPGPGLSYFDPYGEDQPGQWRRFREGMNRVEISESEAHRVVAAAIRTFRAIAEISDGVALAVAVR